MAYSQSDLDALDRAIATGATRVDIPSVGVVNYRSLAEMRAIRATMVAAINAASGSVPIRRIKPYSTKDL